MEFISHQVLTWGVDSVSDPFCAAIVDCIKRGGRPEDLADWPKNRTTIEKVAAKYELINTVIAYNNAPFFHLFLTIALQNKPHLYRITLLQKCIKAHCSIPELVLVSKSVMLDRSDISMLLANDCIRHGNYAALEWLYNLSSVPRSFLERVRENAIKAETFDWLALHNAADINDMNPTEMSIWLRHVLSKQHDMAQIKKLIAAVGRDKIRSNSQSILEIILSAITSYRATFGWLLHCFAIDELLAFNQKLCAVVILQHGASDLFAHLPSNWTEQFEEFNIFFHASQGGVTALNFVAQLLPNSTERCYASLLIFNRLTPEVFLHVLQKVPLTDDLLIHIAEINFMAFPERIPLIVSMKPDPTFWALIIQSSTKISVNTIVWFDNYFRSHGMKLTNFNAHCALVLTLIESHKTGDNSEILCLFDLLPAPAVDHLIQHFQIECCGVSSPPHALISDDESEIILRRLWWQHQRAKSGLLVAAALRARRAPHLPPELWNWFVHEYLSGL